MSEEDIRIQSELEEYAKTDRQLLETMQYRVALNISSYPCEICGSPAVMIYRPARESGSENGVSLFEFGEILGRCEEHKPARIFINETYDDLLGKLSGNL